MSNYPTTSNSSGAVVIRPTGDITLRNALRLREDLCSLIDDHNYRIAVDLGDVGLMDSAGLGALISGLKSARQRGGDLVLVSPNEWVMVVLERTNLSRIFQYPETAEQAFA